MCDCNHSDNEKKNVFEPVEARPDYPKMEESVLDYWKQDGTFEESVRFREDKKDFVFYDGPPFANGLPHYGHVLTGFVKDVVPRYKTMRGYHVPRNFGWDCHGLPAEMEMEKEAGISGRNQIMDYGLDKFNEGCSRLVFKYVDEWEGAVNRQGRWVDFKNDYKTLDRDFMESVLWAFKTLHDKGLVYKGSRVLAYCSRCETPLSNFETRIDNSTRPKQDPAVTVLFSLKDNELLPAGTSLLVWTTTPWTLPSNLGIAVGKDIEYVLYKDTDGKHFLLAGARAEAYKKQLEGMEQVRTVKGSELVGLSYQPLFDYFKDTENAFRIMAGDFVTTEDGSGVVHMAPGFGEDDQKLCDANGIETIAPIDLQGRFDKRVPDYEGRHVFDTNKDIIKRLRDEGKLVRQDTIDHNYPHCWRCDMPLIYRALPSWYVKVTEFKDRMLEANKEINWIPGHIKDGQFGRWIADARDWSISRNRFWGTPLPVWECDNADCENREVYGSIAELEEAFGTKVEDLHRPMIDELTRPCAKCGGTMKRVEDVLDCWFESGSMPYAQVHYPFENKDWFEKNFPADFIVEYVAQTRGWFYTMTILSTALFGKPAFLNSICHGVVLDENNQKLSKRYRNYPPLEEIFDSLGADTLRWAMMSNTILRGGNMNIDKDGKNISMAQKAALSPLWNSYYFLVLYANIDGYKPSVSTASKHEMDIYILSKLSEALDKVTAAMDIYDIPTACAVIEDFLEILTNWYIRRNRRRFWKSESDTDKKDAYDTLYTVLVTFSRMAAPLLPFTSEAIYRNLTGGRSVHLSDWPTAEELTMNADVLSKMDVVRRVCSLGHAVRNQARVRVRQPLPEVMLAGNEAHLAEDYTDIIMDELNVKSVAFTDDVGEMGTQEIIIDARVLGPRLGKKMKDVMASIRSGNVDIREDGVLSANGVEIAESEYELRINAQEGHACMSDGGLFACLDLTINRALELEGLARDIIRLVQNARREADLIPDERIGLSLVTDGDLKEAAEAHSDFIKAEVLATDLAFDAPTESFYTEDAEIQGTKLGIAIVK